MSTRSSIRRHLMVCCTSVGNDAADYKAALELEPDISLAKARVPILEKKASEQQQKEMQEMMGKCDTRRR